MIPRVVSLFTQFFSLTALILVASGCAFPARGFVYTDTVQPLCQDLRGTILGSKSADGSSKRIQIPTTRFDITAEWDTRAIGDIAKENGISTVYGCDSRIQSLLMGLWRKDTVIVYGE